MKPFLQIFKTTSLALTRHLRAVLVLCILCSLLGHAFQLNKLSQLAKQRYGNEAFQTILELESLLSSLNNVSDQDKLIGINNFFNQKINFVDDIDAWDQSDYWATPLESLGRQAGDCEDFSIAKYVFLKMLHIPNDKLRLTYVRAQLGDSDNKFFKAHMVLSYYASPDADPLILDNLKPQVLPASRRPDLNPVFSFNNKGLWVGNSTQPKANSQTHLSKWRDVLLRIQQDGIE